MAIKIASRGYTIEVTSWENDGDNYRTERMTVDTLEEAKKIKSICKQLFASENDTVYAVGNTMDGKGNSNVDAFIADHPGWNLTKEYLRSLAWELMGGCEYYDFRVCESVTVTFLSCDLFAEEIE
jgi:hypothetical protein